jgi:hypothetical protein
MTGMDMTAPPTTVQSALDRLARDEFCLPTGFGLIRLQDLPRERQAALLSGVFALIEGEYGPWLVLETVENWLEALGTGNRHGTRMAVSVALDASGQVIGASATEIYRNGTAIINYSVGRKADADYLEVIAAVTRDMTQGLRDMQASGVEINLVVKEHHLDSPRAQAGYFAVGQVPLDGPTSLLPGPVKYFEIACGHSQDLNDPEKLRAALALTDPQTARTVDGVDDEVHLWLLGDFTPSRPDLPLAGLLRQLADAHAGERSIFRERDIRLDIGWQSLQKMADLLPPGATYLEALAASRRGAARFMGLQEAPDCM